MSAPKLVLKFLIVFKGIISMRSDLSKGLKERETAERNLFGINIKRLLVK